MAQGTKEIHFEEHIEHYLTTESGFRYVSNDAFDKNLCLVPHMLIDFIRETQPKAYIALLQQYGTTVNEKIVENVANALHKQKTLDVLRNGVKDRGQLLRLVYFQPANNKTPEHEEMYKLNRFGIVRQFQYSNRNNNSIDLAIFINGIPVLTAELKNALTGQNHYNAIKQYVQDRDPKGEPLLEFKRCLVHFAVGTEKVFMTTELKGKSTFFLPFNTGLVNQSTDDFAVSYLWKDVWEKDSLLDLIQNYINVQIDTKQVYDPASKKLIEKKSTKLLFPRFHQRRAVNRILEALKRDGTGKNYLIQHSAGSGKSNTITWLAYRLANFYQHYTDSKGMFDSVIIVTDRRVLNKQIQDNIRQFDNTPGVVQYIDENVKSDVLRKAIEDGKRIIVTTLHRFPIISESVQQFPNRKYAILIDEAHSSQSGEAARHMRKALSLEEAEKLDVEEKTLDDIIAEEISRKGQQPNISQFAFTATPKPKTIELFGTVIDDVKTAFDKYTMEEAIKEEFILDVLMNYMSFKRYYKLVKQEAIPDKEYEKKKTVRLLNSFVDLEDHAIEVKSRIMLEHFASQTANEIQGQARAMLVTRSRLHAVRFKRKFDEIMREMKLPYEALVAFSGIVKDAETGEEYTESSMNQLTGKISIPEALKLPKYRILIVADKYQTGFDEPLMHTMFVDKKLGGTSTVQTLSRLNRTMRGKNNTMILDFVNDSEQIQADFQHFYGANFMLTEDETDPNSLYDLLNQIEAYPIIYQNDVEVFAEIFFRKDNNMEKLQPILQSVVKRFEENLNDEDKSKFKSSVKSFVKVYRFLSQILTFTDVDLEKKYVFLTALLKVLPYLKSDMPFDVLNDVELDSYKLQHKFTTNLSLNSGDGQDKGMSPGSGGQGPADDLDFLSKIIKVLNETFGIDLTEEDKVEFVRMRDNIYNNEELMSFFNPNNSKDNIQDKFNETVDDELLNFIDRKLEFYNKMTEDKVNLLFKRMWFNDLYDRRLRASG